jgi:hypothetical protein
MALTLAQKSYIVQLDNKADEILECFGMPGLMLSLADSKRDFSHFGSLAPAVKISMMCASTRYILIYLF